MDKIKYVWWFQRRKGLFVLTIIGMTMRIIVNYTTYELLIQCTIKNLLFVVIKYIDILSKYTFVSKRIYKNKNTLSYFLVCSNIFGKTKPLRGLSHGQFVMAKCNAFWKTSISQTTFLPISIKEVPYPKVVAFLQSGFDVLLTIVHHQIYGWNTMYISNKSK